MAKEVLEYQYQFNFECGHSATLNVRSQYGAERLYKTLRERQNGLCAVCYHKSKHEESKYVISFKAKG